MMIMKILQPQDFFNSVTKVFLISLLNILIFKIVFENEAYLSLLVHFLSRYDLILEQETEQKKNPVQFLQNLKCSNFFSCVVLGVNDFMMFTLNEGLP